MDSNQNYNVLTMKHIRHYRTKWFSRDLIINSHQQIFIVVMQQKKQPKQSKQSKHLKIIYRWTAHHRPQIHNFRSSTISPSGINLYLWAYVQLYGNFDCNRTPIAPQVLTHIRIMINLRCLLHRIRRSVLTIKSFYWRLHIEKNLIWR